MNRRPLITYWRAALALLCLLPSELFACKYNVRDVGFVDLETGPYRLHCFIRSNSPEDFTRLIRETAAAVFLDSNVELQVVNLDRQPGEEALERARAQDLDSFPALLLVSQENKSLRLPLPGAGQSRKEAVWETLEGAVSSPAREALFKIICEVYAVVLLAEGKDPAQNQRARFVAEGAIAQLTRGMEDLPKLVKRPPQLLVVPSAAKEKERVFLWSAGLSEGETEEPAVAVLFGRGRRIGPALRGGLVTQTALYKILAILGQDCECDLDRAWMRGPLIPARWGTDMQTGVQKHVGFDAENPMVKTEISRILERGPSGKRRDSALMDLGDGGVSGYKETRIEDASGDAAASADALSEPARVKPTPVVSLSPLVADASLRWSRVWFVVSGLTRSRDRFCIPNVSFGSILDRHGKCFAGGQAGSERSGSGSRPRAARSSGPGSASRSYSGRTERRGTPADRLRPGAPQSAQAHPGR